MPKAYRMCQVRFKRGSMRTIVLENKESLVLEFDNREEGALRNLIENVNGHIEIIDVQVVKGWLPSSFCAP